VFCEVKDVTGRKELHSIIFIIIESGMALFAIQLACLVQYLSTHWLYPQMLNVVISSVTATLYITDKNVAARV
jgi:hypothetical protein